MLDIINYWLVYGVLVIGLLAFPLYWLSDLVDFVIKDLTNGDFKNVIRNKYKIPLMEKLGFTYTAQAKNLVEDEGTSFKIVISVICCFVGFAVLLGMFIVEGLLPYQVLHAVTESIIPFTQWILIPVGYFLLRNVLRKIYTTIKIINKVLDKEDKSNVDNKE